MACGESLGQFLKPRVSSAAMDSEINLCMDSGWPVELKRVLSLY